MGHAVEQDHHGHGCAADGQDHPGEDGPVVGAIQLGGFFQLGRQGFKVGAHVDEVEHRHQAGQQDGNAAVQQAQIPDHQIGGDHAAVEEHGKGDKDGERLFEQQVFAGQGVGQHGREDHVECGAHDGIENGVQQTAPDFSVGKYPFVGIQGDFLGEKQDAACTRHDGGIGQ